MNASIGPLSYRQEQDSFQKPFSEKTAQLIDDEIRKMVRMAHQRCTDLLTEKKGEVEKVAKLLLEKEVLSRCVCLASFLFLSLSSFSARHLHRSSPLFLLPALTLFPLSLYPHSPSPFSAPT
jgi:hypothetical protein